MHYDADFASADPANAPLDAPLFIGADPLLWLVLLGVVLAAGLFGWWLGRGTSPRHEDASERIWRDVNQAIGKAMKAGRHELPGEIVKLRTLIGERLGDVVAIGVGVGGPLKAMATALEDKPAARPSGGGDAAAKPEEMKSTEARDGGSPANAATTANVTIVAPGPIVIGAPPPETKPAKDDKPMDAKARGVALRAALDDLHDYWSRKTERVDELRRAWRELSGLDLPPARHGPDISHGH